MIDVNGQVRVKDKAARGTRDERSCGLGADQTQ